MLVHHVTDDLNKFEIVDLFVTDDVELQDTLRHHSLAQNDVHQDLEYA
jgi:hypothetical protein